MKTKIIDAVCEFYGISVLELLSDNKKRRVYLPRQVCVYLLRYYGYKQKESAEVCGFSSPSMGYLAQKKIIDYLSYDIDLKKTIDLLIYNIEEKIKKAKAENSQKVGVGCIQ